MKNQTTRILSAVAALLLACGFMPIQPNSPQGVWQQTMLVKDKSGQHVTVYFPAYKFLPEENPTSSTGNQSKYLIWATLQIIRSHV